jgi:hypothetical protein
MFRASLQLFDSTISFIETKAAWRANAKKSRQTPEVDYLREIRRGARINLPVRGLAKAAPESLESSS